MTPSTGPGIKGSRCFGGPLRAAGGGGEQFQGCRFIGCNFSWLPIGESRFVDCYDRAGGYGCLFAGAAICGGELPALRSTMADFVQPVS